MKPKGRMFLSGFYVDDVPIVAKAAEATGLTPLGHTERDRWACLELTLKPRRCEE